MFKAIIVEDQKIYSDKLKRLLRDFDNTIDIVAVTTNIADSVIAIKTHRPELLFLDIQLQDNDTGGFEILSLIDDLSFYVVFTTAHINENIEQIREFGLHYMPKPYVMEELKDAVKKFSEKKNGNTDQHRIQSLLNSLSLDSIDEPIVWLRDNAKKVPLKVKQILYCETVKGKGEKTKFTYIDHEVGGVQETITNGLIGEWEDQLTRYQFCRIHKSFLINYKQIATYTPGEDLLTLKYLKDKTFPVSRDGKAKLDELMRF